jgi:hypothetical protein
MTMLTNVRGFHLYVPFYTAKERKYLGKPKYLRSFNNIQFQITIMHTLVPPESKYSLKYTVFNRTCYTLFPNYEALRF